MRSLWTLTSFPTLCLDSTVFQYGKTGPMQRDRTAVVGIGTLLARRRWKMPVSERLMRLGARARRVRARARRPPRLSTLGSDSAGERGTAVLRTYSAAFPAP